MKHPKYVFDDKQEYYCEGCGVESHVYYYENEGAYSVIQKIERDHKKWSPECHKTFVDLRII